MLRVIVSWGLSWGFVSFVETSLWLLHEPEQSENGWDVRFIMKGQYKQIRIRIRLRFLS